MVLISNLKTRIPCIDYPADQGRHSFQKLRVETSFRLWCSDLWHYVILWMETMVLEKHAVSVFGVLLNWCSLTRLHSDTSQKTVRWIVNTIKAWRINPTINPNMKVGLNSSYCAEERSFKFTPPLNVLKAVGCTEVCSIWRIKHM